MKGDFSRIRFNPAALYTAVLKQQGRVDLDSDANEQCFIDGYIDGTTNVDVIGQYGGPVGNAGFQIGVSGESITIGSGRYYVNGLLVENPEPVSYDEQLYLDSPTNTAEQLLAAINGGGSTVQFVLEVWQRLAIGLDDNCLLEPALGQADTTTRLQTVWRVIGSIIPTSAVPPSGPVNPTNPVTLLAPCCQMLYGSTPEVHDGVLTAETNQTGNDCGCQPIAAAGYQGLENQLYRVEIHSTGTVGSATFKWSRENASVVSQITYISGAVLTVSSLGPDANLGFQNSQWVELTDDTYSFAEPANHPGQLYQILTVNQATLQVTLTIPVSGVDYKRNARMRRWDQFGTLATAQGVTTSSTPVQLENGIEVTFGGGNYLSGDYWTIPARTADGQIEWPPCGSNGNPSQPASYIQIYDAPLACMALRPSNSFVPQAGQTTVENYVISDCRLLFSPLTVLSDEAATNAVHVSAISWANDDVMTVDTLLQNGLFVTFDQATTCPWGGGNFKVSMELATSADPLTALEGNVTGLPAPGNFPPGTNILTRTVLALDPPLGMSVSGTQVTWMTPSTAGLAFWETYYLYSGFNAVLNAATPIGFARVRVRLDGGAVYANGPAGNLYLDGTALGQTGVRVADGSPCVSLSLPTGSQLKTADFESWFYLAPSLMITAANIQLLNAANVVVGSNAVTVASDELFFGHGLETTATTASPSVPVQTVNLLITFTYPPVAPATLTFQITYSGAASVISIPNQTVSPGQAATLNVPITIIGNPGVSSTGAANVDTVTIVPAISGLISPVAFTGTAPTLVITGAPEGTIKIPFGGVAGLAGTTNLFQNAADVANQALEKQVSEQLTKEEAKPPQSPEEPQQ
ncbi:MAG TPA: DUF6519 domain-containing protein [Silvibacterium sp.]|nr:DUF6519 domain-containing protein [Silvibacterium sp.]